jgi:hypothetical protein
VPRIDRALDPMELAVSRSRESRAEPAVDTLQRLLVQMLRAIA